MLVVLTNEEYRNLKNKADKYDMLQNEETIIKNKEATANVSIGDIVILNTEGACTQGFRTGDICVITGFAQETETYPIEILRLRDIKDKCYGYVYKNQIEKVKEEK